jgi:hypothetical protein
MTDDKPISMMVRDEHDLDRLLQLLLPTVEATVVAKYEDGRLAVKLTQKQAPGHDRL